MSASGDPSKQDHLENKALVTLSDEAVAATRSLQAENPDYASKSLRLYIDGKGCDGFYYGVTFDDRSEEDQSIVQDGITIIVDGETLQFVRHSLITWVDDERGRGFIVENPNHKKFKGKFFKRDRWQERLSQQN